MADGNDPKRILDYRAPELAAKAAERPPISDGALLSIALVTLLVPPSLLLLPIVTESSACVAVPILGITWPVASLVVVFKAKRRIYPTARPEDRPNRLIAALIASSVSTVLFVVAASYAVTWIQRSLDQIGSHERLRDLGTMFVFYGNDHHGELPPDLCTLIRGKYGTLSSLQTSKIAAATPPAVTPTTTDQDLIAAKWTSYLYLGVGGRRVSSYPAASTEPLVIQFLPEQPDKALVLFLDGHNEAVSAQQAILYLSRHLAAVHPPTSQPASPPTAPVTGPLAP